MGRGVALGRAIGDGAAGCPGANAAAAEVLRRLWRRRELHTLRAAVATCKGAACVPVIRTKVFTNGWSHMGAFAMHAWSRCGRPPSEDTSRAGSRAAGVLPFGDREM